MESIELRDVIKLSGQIVEGRAIGGGGSTAGGATETGSLLLAGKPLLAHRREVVRVRNSLGLAQAAEVEAGVVSCIVQLEEGPERRGFVQRLAIIGQSGATEVEAVACLVKILAIPERHLSRRS